MKTLLTITLCLFWMAISATGPLKFKNKQPTQYYYYSNKYSEIWEPHDTIVHHPDTMYIYRLGGQQFKFNQDGKLIINN